LAQQARLTVILYWLRKSVQPLPRRRSNGIIKDRGIDCLRHKTVQGSPSGVLVVLVTIGALLFGRAEGVRLKAKKSSADQHPSVF
jgi:hypothetical protein